MNKFEKKEMGKQNVYFIVTKKLLNMKCEMLRKVNYGWVAYVEREIIEQS